MDRARWTGIYVASSPSDAMARTAPATTSGHRVSIGMAQCAALAVGQAQADD